ncbi:hypothetical protein QJS66_10845 [Kocuria rhizophila]|nr:hypothetical protein QJS66_10845 [Kocuria rhizophila]
MNASPNAVPGKPSHDDAAPDSAPQQPSTRPPRTRRNDEQPRWTCARRWSGGVVPERTSSRGGGAEQN